MFSIVTKAVVIVVVILGCAKQEPGLISVPFSSQRIELHRAGFYPEKGFSEMTVPQTGKRIYVKNVPDITINDIAETSIIMEDGFHGILGLKFNKAGQEKIDAISREHQSKPIAVFLEGKLRSAPTIQSQYPYGFMIPGIFPREEAERLIREVKK